MAKNKKRRKDPKKGWKEQLRFELAGLFLFAITCITLAKLGTVGEIFVQLFRFFFGEWYILLVLGMFSIALYLIVKRKKPPLFSQRLLGVYIFSLAFVLSSHVSLFESLMAKAVWSETSVIKSTWEMFWMEVKGESTVHDLGGGMVGALLFSMFYVLFDVLGTKLIVFVLMVAAIMFITGKSMHDVFSKIFTKFRLFMKEQWTGFLQDLKNLKNRLSRKKTRKKEKNQNQQQSKYTDKEVESLTTEEDYIEEFIEPEISDFAERAYTEQSIDHSEQEIQEQPMSMDSELKEKPSVPEQIEKIVEDATPLVMSAIENQDYQLPPLDLLATPQHNGQNLERRKISENARKLEKTFQSFGVKAKVMKVHLGPAVTKYEVYPDVGVKVSKIVNLSDDLALALAAKDIRIEAPIPGKSAVGIEVPNQEVAMVSLREVLESDNNHTDKLLQFALGRDISGEAVLGELNKMPHLLVAGATGSGKSVCINGIIASILMRAKPHEVKMMMIDPKMVELNVYNGIPHLLAPVVTDAKKASQALKKVVAEMERRYDLFSHTGTRNIEGYNTYIKRHNEEEDAKQPTLPYVVVIVDELADLMMVASSDVEDAIARLAQMARAAGIHLIIATQRPSVDVITGVIKANIPSRVAFSVSSQIDSRTILDSGGAEKLLGRGDMLFMPVGASKPVRVQGAFLSDEEVEEVVDFVISQQKAQYQEDMIPKEEPETTVEINDELYDDAVQLISEMQTASVSMLQRRFRIGYTRAARLIDAMEAQGIVGPYEGSKPREVLISKQEEEATS
ncbi:FtsK/SpoIIIE family DNA translocase [Bacillus solimangrovi]|uniref:Cell division protein FtsK n=1 Tax=Bacillus solimangrovi TaxID=1305675 RepID=A0A1E5LJA9_9BACI|nr:DNA translocase FtsK [Bacillus solimangrovi]OEH94151.1 cell division protein FtsK [Bacillus solimangrovi]